MIVDHWVLVQCTTIYSVEWSLASLVAVMHILSLVQEAQWCVKMFQNCKVVGVRKITQSTSGWWGYTKTCLTGYSRVQVSKQYDAKNLLKKVDKFHWFPATDSLSCVPENVDCWRFQERYKSLSRMKRRISWKKLINLIDSQLQILSRVYPKMEIAEGLSKEVFKFCFPITILCRVYVGKEQP